MRIIGLLLILSVISIPAFAADSVDEATVRIVLDLGNENNVEIGFSESEVASNDSVVDKIENLNLSIDENHVANNLSNPVYAYWKIMSASNLSISIYGNRSLQSLFGDSGTIDWGIGLLDDISEESGMPDIQSYNQVQTLYTHSPGSGIQSVGSKQIGIVTDNLDNAAAGEYTANLVLDVTIN